MSGRVSVGVDVGGTFTDLVVVDERSGRIHVGKLLTTPGDPDKAILDGLIRVLRESGIAAQELDSVVHGTTLVTNTVIERTGAKVGLVTTEGFRDSLEMGKEIRYDLYDLFLEPVPSLVPRKLRRGVAGRISAQGEELAPFDEAGFRATVRDLVELEAIESLAVSFMHAYRNPVHERRAGEILAAEFPTLPHTLSHAVAPEIREFERASTATANAYVQPLMLGYLGRLERSLRSLGVDGEFYVMLSGGGIATIEQAQAFPIQLIESGPAAGAMAASHYGRLTGQRDLISFDMGGTTAKMCLIEGARPQRTHDFEAGRVRRFKKGSGLPLKVSVVDMIEIGAGGGSIASIDSMGLLKVGPKSAGSEPGPVAYGRGGSEPTVTDADVLLGYLNPDFFLGGEMVLDRVAVMAAMQSRLADPLDMDLTQAAVGIHRVVNENMASATRRYLAEKGKDPRRYAMIAFGGAGPVHAYGLAKLLKISRLIVPFGAGVTSALGFLVAPPAVDDVRSYVSRLEAVDWALVNDLYGEMESAAKARLVEAGANPDEVRFERRAEMRHVGQGFEIEVPIPGGALGADSMDAIRDAFFETYQQLFERQVTEVGIEAMSWRLGASAPPRSVPLNFTTLDGAGETAEREARDVLFPDFGTLRTRVLDRYVLVPGDEFAGPVVIEERESTTVVGPDAKVVVDEQLNLIIDIE